MHLKILINFEEKYTHETSTPNIAHAFSILHAGRLLKHKNWKQDLVYSYQLVKSFSRGPIHNLRYILCGYWFYEPSNEANSHIHEIISWSSIFTSTYLLQVAFDPKSQIMFNITLTQDFTPKRSFEQLWKNALTEEIGCTRLEDALLFLKIVNTHLSWMGVTITQCVGVEWGYLFILIFIKTSWLDRPA